MKILNFPLRALLYILKMNRLTTESILAFLKVFTKMKQSVNEKKRHNHFIFNQWVNSVEATLRN